ncbi:MAG: TlpA family protein disulfide reductase [Planctomycetota bacterium]|jgi:thiol-disulfide isomerase/thioredoxin
MTRTRSDLSIGVVFAPMALLAGLLLASTSAPAAPPTDEQIEQIGPAYKQLLAEHQTVTEEVRRAAADDAIGDLDFAALSLAQLESVMDGSDAYFYSSRRPELDARLARLGKDATRDGARALVLRLNCIEGKTVEEQHEVLRVMLDHPSLGAALADGELWLSFMNLAWWYERGAAAGLEPDLVELGRYIPPDAPMLGLLGAVDIFDTVASSNPTGYEQREPLRKAVIAALQRGLTYVDPKDPELQRWNFAHDIHGHLRWKIDRLESRATRGKLIDHPAPEIHFIWASDGHEWKRLSDLEGKIVVLDFWTTWCGPCIGSFPQMRELVARYEGYPVQVIGVTSIQGAHYGEGGRVITEGEPEKETSLMPSFMTEKGMTWPVVFAKKRVYHPDFDVDGIPHVTIIDAKGIVRVNGLHPYNDHEKELKAIDGLLREMGLDPPAGE